MYGRRFLIMFPLLGFLILYVVLMTLSLVDGIPADFLLFESLQVIRVTQYLFVGSYFSIVQDLTGGFSVLMLGAFAHVCDVTTPKSRMSRMCFLEMIFILGLELGLGLSEPLYTIAGYAPAYVISIVLVRRHRTQPVKRMTSIILAELADLDWGGLSSVLRGHSQARGGQGHRDHHQGHLGRRGSAFRHLTGCRDKKVRGL